MIFRCYYFKRGFIFLFFGCYILFMYFLKLTPSIFLKRCLFIMNPLFLREFSGHKSCIVFFNTSINCMFYLVDPFRRYHTCFLVWVLYPKYHSSLLTSILSSLLQPALSSTQLPRSWWVLDLQGHTSKLHNWRMDLISYLFLWSLLELHTFLLLV